MMKETDFIKEDGRRLITVNDESAGISCAVSGNESDVFISFYFNDAPYSCKSVALTGAGAAKIANAINCVANHKEAI